MFGLSRNKFRIRGLSFQTGLGIPSRPPIGCGHVVESIPGFVCSRYVERGWFNYQDSVACNPYLKR